MVEISDRTLTPYRSICYIRCEWSDGTITRASGVVIGINDVLTALHVVYSPSLGYATRIYISPAADSSPLIEPFGEYSDVGVINGRTGNWDTDGDLLLTAAESQYDLALLGLNSAIGNVTGWLQPVQQKADFNGEMVGYPGRGTGMMSENVFADAAPDVGVYAIASGLGAGASGGPLLYTAGGTTYVAGVLSAGRADNTRSTYAALYGPGNWDWLTASMASNDSVLANPNAGADLTGTAGADNMSGTARNDTFRGLGGNDRIDGLAGTDTAVYTGARASYRLSETGTSLTVMDTVSGRDGTDTLNNIERLVFSDMTINLEIGAQSARVAPAQLKLLEELYVAFFNRVPDADGLAYWIGQSAAGVPVPAIADAFYNAALLYPAQTGYRASMTSADFVTVIYKNVLGRSSPDAEGLQFWSSRLDSGQESRGSLVSSILASAHTFKGKQEFGWVADLLDNKAFVAQAFAVERGITYNTPEQSIAKGMDIAGAVTPTDTGAAIALIGVNDGFSTLS